MQLTFLTDSALAIKKERGVMDLTKRFEEATSCASVTIGSLEINKLYPIVGVKRIATKYEPRILLSIRESEAKVVKIFLPRRYCAVISDDDMEKINSKAVSLKLEYRGIYETSNSYLLAIES